MTLTRFCELLFVLLALAFVVSLDAVPYGGDELVKVAPILCLLVIVFYNPGGAGRNWIMPALLFSACGDVLLELGHFTPGLAAFLLAHLCYLGAFCRQPQLTAWRGAALAALLLCSLGLYRMLAPHLGELQVAVTLYQLVIAAMAAAAILGGRNHPLVALGAVLFVASDSLIAYNRFVGPVEGARYWIMLSYYAAQFFLTRDARRPPQVSRGIDSL